MGAGEVCGAVSGGVLAIGLLYGQEYPDIADQCTKEFMHRFSESEGSVRCNDLIGFDIIGATSGEDFGKVVELLWFFAKGGKKVCKRAVSSSVKIVLEQWNERNNASES